MVGRRQSVEKPSKRYIFLTVVVIFYSFFGKKIKNKTCDVSIREKKKKKSFSHPFFCCCPVCGVIAELHSIHNYCPSRFHVSFLLLFSIQEYGREKKRGWYGGDGDGSKSLPQKLLARFRNSTLPSDKNRKKKKNKNPKQNLSSRLDTSKTFELNYTWKRDDEINMNPTATNIGYSLDVYYISNIPSIVRYSTQNGKIPSGWWSIEKLKLNCQRKLI